MSLLEALDWAAKTGNYSAANRYTREEVNDRAFMRAEHEKSLALERQAEQAQR
jgi:hypothetical protein